MIDRPPALLLATLLSLGTPVAASAAPAEATASPQVEQIRPDPHAPQVGSGPHRYQFVLRDTVSAAPAALRPFALSHTAFDLPFVAAEKDVYQGITDAQGRTPVFAFEQAPPRRAGCCWNALAAAPMANACGCRPAMARALARWPTSWWSVAKPRACIAA